MPYQPLTHKEVNVHRYALLSLLAGSFFSSRVISSLRAVNVGSGRSNRRIKSRTKAKVVATGVVALNMILAGVSLGQFGPPNFEPTTIEWTGVTSNDWLTNTNWVPLTRTPNSDDNVSINTITNNRTFLSGGPHQTVHLIRVGGLSPGTGSLTINSGGQLTIVRFPLIGDGPSTDGTVTITGQGSSFTALEGARLGEDGTGALNILAGGKFSTPSIQVGNTSTGKGTIIVDGAGSIFTATGLFEFGFNRGGPDGPDEGTGAGTGTLMILGGGKVVESHSVDNVVFFGGDLGRSRGGIGMATVSGTGSEWDYHADDHSAVIDVGFLGAGTLTIQDNGLVSTDTVVIASRLGSTGTLNIGAAPGSDPVAPGTLETSQVMFGSGTGTINFNHTANNYIFAPTISGGPGTVNVLAGTTILTGNNTYGGGTNISQHTTVPTTLAVGVPDSSDATVTAGSFALGTGDVSLTGGTLRTTSLLTNIPGVVTGKPYKINIGGNFTMRQGSTLSLGIGGLLPKQYDRVQVGGNAILSGNLVVSSLNGFHPSAGNAFLVLRTNGIRLGNFSQLNDSAFNNNPSISSQLRPVDVELVAPNGIVLLYLKQTSPSPSPPSPSPPSPRPPIIDLLPELLPPLNPDEPISKEEVVKLVVPNVEQMTALYEIGFSAANMQRFNLGDRMFQIQQGMTGFVSPITPAPLPAPTGKEITEGKGVEGKAPPPAPQPGPTNRWGIWANGWGDFVHLDSTSAAQGYNFTTGGMSAGVDYLITDHFAVGLFGGYSHTWVNFNSSGAADVNTGRGGLYATYFQQGWWINAAVWGGGNSYSTSRQALAGQANGETDGWELSTFGDAGYDFHCGDLSFGPTVSMQYTDVHIGGFGEHGSLVPLNIHGDSQDSLRTDVGGQAYYRWHVGNIPVIPNVRLAWEHEYFYSALPITATAPTLDGATATFSGPNEGHDSLIINANIAVQWTPRIWTTIGYDGQVARDNYNSNAVTGTFSFSF